MKNKLSKQIVNDRLKDRSLRLIGEYKNSQIKTAFKCLVPECRHIWSATPNNILRGKGCPKCSDNKLSTDIINSRIKNRSLIMIGEYKNANKKTLFKCLVKNCNHEWETTPNSIIFGNGCPKCKILKKSLTKEIVDDRLKDRPIMMIGLYIKSSYKTLFKCLNNGCEHEWLATPNKILMGRGCPKCAGNLLKSKNDVNEQLYNEKRNILLVGDYINARTVTKFKCLNKSCRNIWLNTPHNILTGTGCPKCVGYGFDKSLETILYYIRIDNKEGSFYKIGITNRDINKRFMKWELDMITPIFERKYESGIDAYNEEQRILKEHSEHLYSGGSKILNTGNREIFIKDVLGIDYDRKI